MVLIPARLLLLLLWFVSAHCTSAYNLEDGGGAAAAEEWENLSKLVYEEKEDEEGDVNSGYFYGRSAPYVPAYNPPASQPVSKAETHKPLFQPEGHTQPMPAVITDMLLEAGSLPLTVEQVRRNPEILCHFDRMFVRLRRDTFNQDIMQDLRFGKCNVTLSNAEYYYYFHFVNEDCGTQKEVCTALSFECLT